jgi:hypothetical protein
VSRRAQSISPAALLRGRQVVIAVHEPALFDYLTHELSPACPRGSLIAVEITRPPEAESHGDAARLRL